MRKTPPYRPRELLAEIEQLSSKEFTRAAEQRSLQGTQELEERLGELGQHVLLLPDAHLRERLEFVCRALGETSSYLMYADMSERQAVFLLCKEGRGLLGAYLRGSRYRHAQLPREPDLIKQIRSALNENDEIIEEYFREQDEAKRRAAEERARGQKAVGEPEPEQGI